MNGRTPGRLRTVPIDDLRPHPRNPRQGDIGAVTESIVRNGFYGVIVVQKANRSRKHPRILAGEHRWRAAKAAGLQEVDVHEVDVDDDTALRILLADNRTGDRASYDDNRLVELLQDLAATDEQLTGTGWDRDDLDDLVTMLDEPPDLEAGGSGPERHACPACGRWLPGDGEPADT